MSFVYISCPHLGNNEKRELYKSYANYVARYIMDMYVGIPINPFDYLHRYFSETDPEIIRDGEYFNHSIIKNCFMFISCEDFGISASMLEEKKIAEKTGLMILRFKENQIERIYKGGDINV